MCPVSNPPRLRKGGSKRLPRCRESCWPGAICGRPSSPALLLLRLQAEPLRTPSLATRGSEQTRCYLWSSVISSAAVTQAASGTSPDSLPWHAGERGNGVLFVVVRHHRRCCYSCCKRNLSGLPPLRRG